MHISITVGHDKSSVFPHIKHSFSMWYFAVAPGKRMSSLWTPKHPWGSWVSQLSVDSHQKGTTTAGEKQGKEEKQEKQQQQWHGDETEMSFMVVKECRISWISRPAENTWSESQQWASMMSVLSKCYALPSENCFSGNLVYFSVTAPQYIICRDAERTQAELEGALCKKIKIKK